MNLPDLLKKAREISQEIDRGYGKIITSEQTHAWRHLILPLLDVAEAASYFVEKNKGGDLLHFSMATLQIDKALAALEKVELTCRS